MTQIPTDLILGLGATEQPRLRRLPAISFFFFWGRILIISVLLMLKPLYLILARADVGLLRGFSLGWSSDCVLLAMVGYSTSAPVASSFT